MSTAYTTVYNKFLSKINDLELIGLDQDVAEDTMKGYMETACDNFTQCTKDLSDRDDDEGLFNSTLTGFEINVIATSMLYEWVQPHINKTMLTKQYLSSQDFKTYSQANHLKELQSLRDSYEERMDFLMTRYSYTFGDWEDLGLE